MITVKWKGKFRLGGTRIKVVTTSFEGENLEDVRSKIHEYVYQSERMKKWRLVENEILEIKTHTGGEDAVPQDTHETMGQGGRLEV